MSRPKNVFLDANVWFTAARSPTGGSFLILQLAKRGLISISANQHVLREAERNLLLKSPQHIGSYYSLLSEAKPAVLHTRIPEDIARRLKRIVPPSDVPVLAGAMLSKAEYLITLDKRDIANDKVKKLPWPFDIVLPGEFLKIFLHKV